MSNDTTQHIPADVRERVKGAWATVEAAALAQADLLDSHYGGQRAKAAEIRNAVERVAALLRTPRGEGEAEPLAWRVEFRPCGEIEWQRFGTYDYPDIAEDRALILSSSGRMEYRIVPLYPAALRSEAQGEEEALVQEILAELGRAREKFPGDNVTTLALVEEVGELAKATFEESRDRVRQEAIQVAVMAMRVVLDGDQTLDAWRESKGLDPLTAVRRGEGGE